MKDMRVSVYVSLMVLGWVVSMTLAADPFARVNDILNNETTLRFYANCFLDRGPCSADGRAIKRLLPEFISTSCARCTAKQKQTACQIISTMQQAKYSDLWAEFVNRYDPVGQNQSKLAIFKQFCLDSYSIVT